MMNPNEGYVYRQSVLRFLHLQDANEVELHLSNGHVVIGMIRDVLWEAGGDWIVAVEVRIPLAGDKYYTRLVLWDHVLEVRPSIEEN